MKPVLVLSNPSSTDITVQVFITDGSATGEYDEVHNMEWPCYLCVHVTGGDDFKSGPYNVTFSDDITSISFDVPINNDNIFEGDEEFMLSIDRSSLPTDVVVGDSVTVTIIDDDCK